MLRRANLRPTRQRVALGLLLFGDGSRHVTAEALYDQATSAKMPVSLATVYNTLHQFTAAGLLNQIAIDSSHGYFDTNITPHTRGGPLGRVLAGDLQKGPRSPASRQWCAYKR